MSIVRRISPLALCLIPILAFVSARAADDPPAGAAASPSAAAAAPAKEDAKPKEDSFSTKGKLDEVTVYRGQALVTRLVEVPGPTGLREVVVTELPEHVQPASIYAESADGVEVRSVLYRIRPVEQDVREEVRKLDEQILAVRDQIQTTNEKTSVLANQTAFLAKLEQFTAPTASVELTKG